MKLSSLTLASSQVFATWKRQRPEGDSTLEKKSEYVRRDLLCNNIKINRLSKICFFRSSLLCFAFIKAVKYLERCHGAGNK